MYKFWIQRLHRWAALVFALPLLVLFATGLILAFEPFLQAAPRERTPLELSKLEAILSRQDPDGKLERLFLHSHIDTVVLGRRGGTEIDLATGEPRPSASVLLALFAETRRIHETLLVDEGQVFVTASTGVLLVLVALGLAMGPRPFRNSLSGWHTGAAWMALPLIIMPPVTGLLMLYKVTFVSVEPTRTPEAPVQSLAEALGIVAREKDVGSLLSLRQRKGRAEARLLVDGEHRSYEVTAAGLVEKPRNWPKLLHEGNWAGVWSAVGNAAIVCVQMLLLGTGIAIWSGRRLRRRKHAAQQFSVNR